MHTTSRMHLLCVDRSKPGTKRDVVVDRRGVSLAAGLTAANRHDSPVFEALLNVVIRSTVADAPLKKPS